MAIIIILQHVNGGGSFEILSAVDIVFCGVDQLFLVTCWSAEKGTAASIDMTNNTLLQTKASAGHHLIVNVDRRGAS